LIEIPLATVAIAQAQSGPGISTVIARVSESNLTLGDLQKEECGKLRQDDIKTHCD
jgi:hypothetical protein